MSMMRPRKQFIADLWFVFALLTPLFTPMLLVYLTPDHQQTLPSGLCQFMELVLTGPLSLLRAAADHTIDFTSVCVLPTFFVSVHALTLRLMSERSPRFVTARFMTSLGLLMLTHVCLFGVGWVLCGGFGTLPIGLSMLWGSSLVAYVAAASMWVFYRPIRAYGFDLILGLMLMEHLGIPVIGHLLFW